MATSSRSRPGKAAGARTTPAEPAGRRIPVVGIVFGLIGVILVATIVLSGDDSDSDSGPQFGDVEVAGTALPVYPPTGFASLGDDPALGATIPALSGIDLDGNAMTIAADGTPKGIAFLAHWCGHCQAEVPRVTEWVATTGGVEGVEIVSVTTAIDSVRGNYPPDKWLQDEDWPAATMRDSETGAAHLAYGGGGFPYWVFVNADGEVVARTAGQLDTATLERLLSLAAGS